MRTKVDYREIWEKHNGEKIPHAYHIHHIDGNSNNNDPSNLECLSPYEHYLVHKMQGDSREAAMLFARYVRGGNEFPLYGHVVGAKEAIKLKRLNNGLVRLPFNKQNQYNSPEVVLQDMDWVIDDSEPYSEPDVDLVEKLFKRLNKTEVDIISRFYGINFDKMKTKQLALKYKTSRVAMSMRINRIKIKLSE